MINYLSPWKDYLNEFIEYKRICGYYYESGAESLQTFDRYYLSLGINELKYNKEIIEGYLVLKKNERLNNQQVKASAVRQFGKYIFMKNIIDNIYIVPSISNKGKSKYIPYIFTKIEIYNIIDFINNYTPPANGKYNINQNSINSTVILFTILATTGMRLGEVINLKLKDIDFNNNIITIREAKNDNMRIIPFSNSLKKSMKGYISKTPYNINKDDYFLSSTEGKKYHNSVARRLFSKALKYCQIDYIRGKGPRIHDFRHTACCLMLEKMQDTENNINLSLTYLSAFLGHKSIAETQKYIWLTPSLFNNVKLKLEDYSSFIFKMFEEEKFDEED